MRNLKFIFLAAFFFSIHSALISYINSSMLSEHIEAQTISIVYAVSSCIAIILLLYSPFIIRKIGAVRSLVALLLLASILALILGSTINTLLVIPVFVAFFSLSTGIIYLVDIFIEHYSAEQATGKIRGFYLTVNNIAWVTMPLVVGIILGRFGFSMIYLFAAVALAVSGIIIALSQSDYVDKKYVIPKFSEAFVAIRSNPAIRRIISINFLLQFFYVWMVIYVPIYLTSVLMLSWGTVGGIISFMLIPFVLLQYPAGRIADKWLGEKEMIIGGLFIAALSTLAFALLKTPNVFYIAVTLFCTRIGASVVEVMCDSYFFKQVTDKDANLISFYRVVQPLAYVIGTVSGAVILLLMGFITLFMTLAALLAIGALYAFYIVDTK